MKKIILIIYVLIIPSVKSFSQLQDTIFLKNDNKFLNSIQLSENTNNNINLSLNIYKEYFYFLNNKTSLDIEYNDVTYYYVKKYLSYKWLPKIIGLSAYYFPLFESKLAQYNLPPELKYLAIVESNLNPRAISSAGAKGIWQFMPATGKQYGLYQDKYVDLFYDPVASTDAAARYLKYLHDKFGDWNLAISAYNAGPARIENLIKKHKTKNYWKLRPYMPKETQAYVPTFIAINYIFNFYKQHQLKPMYFKYTFFDFQIVRNERQQKIIADPLFKFVNPHLLHTHIPEGVHYYKIKER